MKSITIPGFEIMEPLGQGGMSTVWKARQISLDRIVAIKVLSHSLAAEEADVQRFQFEAQATARLKHPGIIQVYDAGYVNGMYFIVMEHVAGYTVGDWCRRKEKLGEADVLLVAECVADALQMAWKQERIIHCDIKPDNVIIDTDGTVKVADLGLARTLNAVGAISADVGDGEVMGTPNYISPEQSSGATDLDCRSDMYSLGAMMYHIAAGRMLFEGNEATAIMDMQISDRQADVCELNPDISMELALLIEMLLVKNRDNRPKEWSGVLTCIDHVKKGQMPSSTLPEDGGSTMMRSDARANYTPSSGLRMSQSAAERIRERAVSRAQAPEPAGLPWRLIGLLTIIGLAAAYLVTRMSESESADPAAPVAVTTTSTTTVTRRVAVTATTTVTRGPDRAALAREKLSEVLDWVESHPGRHADSVRRLGEVQDMADGTAVAQEVRREIEKFNVRHGMDFRAGRLVGAGNFKRAMRVYRDYSGPYAKELSGFRSARMAKLENEARRRESRERAAGGGDQATGLDQGMDSLAEAVLAGDWERLPALARRIERHPGGRAGRDELRQIRELLRDAVQIDRDIIASFRGDEGREIELALQSGSEWVVISKVRELDLLVGDRTITVADLAPEEAMRRIGKNKSAAAALRKGVLGVEARSYPFARKYFRRVGTILQPALLAKLDELEHEE